MSKLKVIAEILKFAAKAIAKWGAKAWSAIVTFVKNNWQTVARWIAEWGIWEAIEYIAELLGF